MWRPTIGLGLGLVVLICCGGCPTTPAEVERPVTPEMLNPLGSPDNPVRCYLLRGQLAYLSRLRCPDGNKPTFHRIGSFGEGPYGNIIDGYRVRCSPDSEGVIIFMDMYHPGYVETEPVPGFTIVPP